MSEPLKLPFEAGSYRIRRLFVSGDNIKGKIARSVIVFVADRYFKQYAGKTILNNVYMDLRGKKPVFKKTKTAMERNNIFATIRRYAKKLKPQYNGDVYLEKC